MGKAEELVKEKLQQHGNQAKVKYVKGKEARKICCDDGDAFVQLQPDACGSFVGDFVELCIP